MVTPLETRPGVLAVHVMPCGERLPVAECASCGRRRIIKRRGLCRTCEARHEADGTIGSYGYTRAHRLAENAVLRPALAVAQAAARAGVSVRTAWRYEAQLTSGSNSPGCSHDWQYEGDEVIGGTRYRVYRCTRCGWRDRQQA